MAGQRITWYRVDTDDETGEAVTLSKRAVNCPEGYVATKEEATVDYERRMAEKTSTPPEETTTDTGSEAHDVEDDSGTGDTRPSDEVRSAPSAGTAPTIASKVEPLNLDTLRLCKKVEEGKLIFSGQRPFKTADHIAVTHTRVDRCYLHLKLEVVLQGGEEHTLDGRYVSRHLPKGGRIQWLRPRACPRDILKAVEATICIFYGTTFDHMLLEYRSGRNPYA